MKNPLRVLVIGAGPTTVYAHLPVLARLREQGRIVLSVVCDIDARRAEAARRQFGFHQTGGEAMLSLERPDIDVVYVFGSAQMHYHYGLAALSNGKHLFVEKPIAPSFLQARRMATVAGAAGLIAVGGLNRRFYASLAAIRAQGAKARWRFAEAIFHKPEFGRPVRFGARTWLGANGIHALDAMIQVMGGLPDHLTSTAGATGNAPPSAFSALMRWRDGAQGVFLCNNDAGSRREEYTFHAFGETYSAAAAGLTIEKNGSVTTTAMPMMDDGFCKEHQAFLHAIDSSTEPVHSIAAIAPSLFLAELIEAGFSGGVHLPQEEDLDTVRGSMPSGRAPVAGSILVVPCPELQPALSSLLPQHRLVSLEDVQGTPSQRPDIVAAILGRGSAPIPAEVLARLPNLDVVGVMALSLARHEPEVLLQRGITLVNSSAAYAETVADFALGLAILGRRRAFVSHAMMRRGGWGIEHAATGIEGMCGRAARALRPAVRRFGLETLLLRLWKRATLQPGRERPGPAQSRDLAGASVGLIGWGANAHALAVRLAQSRAHVLVYSEHGSPAEIAAVGATQTSLAGALSADVVSLHRGLTPATRHFLGAAELAKLRPGSVLINVARGALIEPAALYARLQRGDVFACLDTFDDEPLPASDPLRRLPNVFLTSHIAGGSPDMHACAATEVVKKVTAYLAGGLPECVTAEKLRTMT
jgi:phosphoglycerate dehydrogenase-like enzyme/predicted dehydrogenase